MVGMLAWKTSQGEKRGKTVTLRDRELLHIRICCAEILRGPKTPESVLRRRVNTAARKLKKAGIGRVSLPEDFSQAEQLEKWELRPVSTLPLRKTLAADWVRRDLKQRGIPAAGARVAVAAGSMTGEVVRTVTELSLRHRYVLLSVPYGGEELCQQLRREYGVSLLLKPTREQLEGADAVLLFEERADLKGTGILPLYDERFRIPPLSLPPALEDALPPGMVQAQLLTVLLESGVLRSGQMAFRGEET